MGAARRDRIAGRARRQCPGPGGGDGPGKQRYRRIRSHPEPRCDRDPGALGLVAGTVDRSFGQPGGHGVVPTVRSSNGTAISQLADAGWVASTARRVGISERALAAYAGASLAVGQTHPGCGLGWNTLAAIGQVESGHGTLNGAVIDGDGIATPTILGPALDGADGVATVSDTDRGRLDGDTTWDHAVGPMQFIPATWQKAAQDGNGDGTTDVNQIDDAALGAAVYLCDVGGDLTVAENWIAAVSAYNQSTEYNNQVAEAADTYTELA